MGQQQAWEGMVDIIMARCGWAAAAVMVLSGCATDYGRGRVTVSARSPEQLLRVFDKAVADGNHATALACIVPSQRRIVAKAARAKAAFDRDSSQLDALMIQRYGEDADQCTTAREHVRGVFARTLSWRRPLEEIEAVSENGRAVLLWQGRPTSLVLRCIDHRWYLRYGDPEGRKEECKYFALMVDQQARKLRLLAKGIEAGELSEEDVRAVMDGEKTLPGEAVGAPQGISRLQKEGIGD